MEKFFRDPRTLLRLRESLLGVYLDPFAKQLHHQGYSPKNARRQILLIEGFSQWLKIKAISVEKITSEEISNYLQYRSQQYKPEVGDAFILKRFLSFLAQEGVIIEKMQPVLKTQIDLVIDKFSLYLQQERAVTPGTVVHYKMYVCRFLTKHFASGKVNLSKLCAVDVINYIQGQLSCMKIKSVKLMSSALRTFFQYARYQGYITLDLALSVPAVANWSKASIPKYLTPDQIELILASCNRQTATGCRDYAILLLLSRLGLRGGEVASLTLDNINWQAGIITVHGKGNHLSQFPLPIDVGEAIVAYLQMGRPQTSNRSLFLCRRAPIRSLKNEATVSMVVRYALNRAGIDAPHKGAHIFRHSLATQMLRQGTSLSEISEVLRHRSIETTTIYAKVDLVSLHKLALPWPGGAK